MERSEVKNAKPSIPAEKPQRRSIPVAPSPFPERKPQEAPSPQVPTTPVRTPERTPVPV